MLQPRNGLIGRWMLPCLVGLTLVCVGGCKSTGTVNGKVTFKKDGSPVPFGSVVTFWGSDDHKATAQTNPDGTYFLPDAPVGEVTVTVMGPSAAAQAVNNMRTTVHLPPKYADPKTGIKKTVQKGSQEINIEIE